MAKSSMGKGGKGGAKKTALQASLPPKVRKVYDSAKAMKTRLGNAANKMFGH